MSEAERHLQDKQFMVECLTKDLVTMLMKEYGYDMQEALNIVYSSNTYKKLENEETGLYYQGAIYVYDFLEQELKSIWLELQLMLLSL